MKKLALVGYLSFMFLSIPAFADLTDYIVVVKPIFHQRTRETFNKLAQRFEKDGQQNLASYFATIAGEHSHGTGWIFVDRDGENYIITNRHVVNQADRVNVYLNNPDGSQISYNDCPILYVDDQFDLAICQFPKKNRRYRKAFEMSTMMHKDLTGVVAAGYPGFGKEPLWQITRGNISNSRVKLNKDYDYLIQHTAAIDPGNSGGPLLVPDAKANLGYRIIGVNTWKAGDREAANFAIPAKDVMTCLEKAKDSRRLALDASEKRARLLRECKILSSEISSQFPDYNRVYRFISYAMVGENGWDALNMVMENVEDKKEWSTKFLDDPVETMRLALFYLFWSDVKGSAKEATALEFKEINYTDSEELFAKETIRTRFATGSRMKEIVWVVEQGHWRVRAFEVPKDIKNASTSASTVAKTESASTNQPVPSKATAPIVLKAAQASLSGDGIQLSGDKIAYWKNRKSMIVWQGVAIPEAGDYVIVCRCSSVNDTKVELTMAGQKITWTLPDTGYWDNSRNVTVGTLSLKPGTYELTLQAIMMRGEFAGDVWSVTLTKK